VADATTFSILIEASTLGIRTLLIKHHEFGRVIYKASVVFMVIDVFS